MRRRIFLVVSFFIFATSQVNATSSKGCDQKLSPPASKAKTLTVDELVASLDGEERVFPILMAGVPFARMSAPEQQQVVERLLAIGSTTFLTIAFANLDKEHQLQLIDDVTLIAPNVAVGMIAMCKHLSGEMQFEKLRGIIQNSNYGDLALLYGSLHYSLRPVVMKNGPALRRVVATTLLGFASVVPPLKKHITTSSFEKLKNLSDAQKAELLHETLKNDPISVIMPMTKANITQDTPLRLPKDKIDLARAITRFAEVRPDLFPPEWAVLATENISSREIALGIIRQLYRLADGKAYLPQSALEVISRSVGLDFAAMVNPEYSRELLHDLFATVLDLQTHLETPALAGIGIDPALLNANSMVSLVQLLSLYRDLLFLRRPDAATWANIRSEMGLEKNGISLSNLQSLMDQAKIAVNKALVEVFASSSDVTREQLQTLRGAWLDTEIVTALAARYNARRGWRPELKVLGRLLKAEAENRFLPLKRFGDPDDKADQDKARAQTAVLNTPAKEQAWWSQWSKVQLYAPNSRSETKNDGVVLSEQSHLAGLILMQLLSLNRALPDSVVTTLLESKDPIPQTLDRVITADRRRDLIPAIGQRLSTSSLKVNEVQKLIAYAKVLLRENPSLPVVTPRLNEILLNLKSLDEKRSAQSKTLIVTTTSHALRTTLGLGCLVDAGSCMDPRQGMRADVIPSLAIDANTQAIFSTALNWGDFPSAPGFQALLNRLEQNGEVQISYNGSTGVYAFSWPGAEPVESRPIEKFYRRHQLKLGTGLDQAPVIRTERAFSQDHNAMPIMKEQIQSIKEHMAAAMGGHVDEEMKSAATRNIPGGTYSDTMNLKDGSGLQKKDYVMPKLAF